MYLQKEKKNKIVNRRRDIMISFGLRFSIFFKILLNDI